MEEFATYKMSIEIELLTEGLITASAYIFGYPSKLFILEIIIQEYTIRIFNFFNMLPIKMQFSINTNYKGRAPLIDNLPNNPPVRPKPTNSVSNNLNAMPRDYIEKNRFSMYLPKSNCTSCGGAV